MNNKLARCLLWLLLLPLCLSACRQNDDLTNLPNGHELEQTQWEGLCYTQNNQSPNVWQVRINFLSDTTLSLGMLLKDVAGAEPMIDPCTYTMDRKLFAMRSIGSGNPGTWLRYDHVVWFLRERTKDHMLFEYTPVAGGNSWLLDLHRKL